MTRLNRNLAVGVGVLLVLSVLVYRQSVRRIDRFERGQKLLQNLDPDEIAVVKLRLGDQSVTLSRVGDRFTVIEEGGYRAANDRVNRLLRDLLEVRLEKEVGSGSALEEELGLDGDSATEIELSDDSEQQMVSLRVASGEPGRTYVQRTDDEQRMVYLTAGSISLGTAADGYLDKQLLDVGPSEIARIEGPDFAFERDDSDELRLIDVPTGRSEKAGETGKMKGALRNLRFDGVEVADAEAVRNLVFVSALRFELTDASGYQLETAAGGDGRYLRVRAFHTVDRIEVARDESEEELEEKAAVLSRVDEVARFNEYHGSWVYRLTDPVADKLELRKGDLLADG